MELRVLQLQEEFDNPIPKASFDEEAALRLHELYQGKLTVSLPDRIKGDNYIIRSSGYIGQIPLLNRYLVIINPKVPLENVFGMLEYAYMLQHFYIYPGSVDVSSVSDLFEKIAFVLARKVLGRAKKGLYRDYITEESSLKYLRGRCNWLRTLNSSLRGSLRVDCKYEENTTDLEDNRILAWTLYMIPRFQMRNPEVLQYVKKAYRVLAPSVRLEKIPAEACLGRFYHRLNDDYEPMHGLCRFFLDHCGPLYTKGERKFIPFLLDMPRLFEEFVARWLMTNLPEGYSAHRKYSVRIMEGEAFRFEMDIVIRSSETNKVLAVLDTKYKEAAGPTRSDICQVVTYALQLNTDKAILVYPSAETGNVSACVGEDHKIDVILTSFDIGGDLEEAGEMFLKDLMSLIS